MRIKNCLATILGASVLVGCSDSSGPESGNFPARLSSLDINSVDAISFAPTYPLWTNGSEKDRKILPGEPGGINISNRNLWTFAEGTRFSKTFSYRNPTGQLRKVETRIILRTATGWEFAVYKWRDDQSDADLIEANTPTAVTVTEQHGTTFDHLIPSIAQCRTCHEAEPAVILGFDELQLNSALPGAGQTQLQDLAGRGFFDRALPTTPMSPSGGGDTVAVAGYIQGNCVHCHNGATQFDMREPGFLQKVIGVPSSIGTLLVSPGHADSSRVFQRFSAGAMPPLGVQLPDTAMVTVFRRWIDNL